MALYSRPMTCRHRPKSPLCARSIKTLRALCTPSAQAAPASTTSAEERILDAVRNAEGRGKEGVSEAQQKVIADAVAALEESGGVTDPTTRADLLDGRWQLLYTSRPGSASPIQRAFTGTEAFTIFQEVRIGAAEPYCRVNNVVEFGDNAKVGTLKVEALASLDGRPLDGFTPRRGAGLPIFGKSQTGPPAADNMRIDFQFDRAAFDIRKVPFKIPYPVPFRQLGDETKGWIDITYMNADGTFRLTRGNKGTLFILVKRETLVDELLVAARDSDDDRVLAVIDRLKGTSATEAPARDAVVLGKWRLLWTQQAEDANPLQKALSGQARSWQIIEQGAKSTTLENRIDLGVATVRALASCEPTSDERTEVRITRVFAEIFGREVPIGGARDDVGFVEWLYVDERVRVTIGSRGSLFVHKRELEADNAAR